MIVDQLFNPKPLREGEVYDLGREYGAPAPAKKKRSQDPDNHNPYPYSREEDDDYFREIFRKKREAAKKAEQNKLDEARLLEDPVYRKFKVIGRYIAERKLTEPEILKIFADAESGMTDKATGANRTFLGRGKDTATDFASSAADALKGVWSGIQSSVPISAVDTAYDKATDALADLTGGQKGAIMQAIKKYRMLAKEYPKTAGLAKGALVAITGLATGGAGLPAVAALVYGLDSAIKGEKFSDIALKAGGAAATAWAASKIAGMFGGDAQAATTDSVSQAPVGAPVDGGTYTIMQGDQLGYIAQAQGTTPEAIRAANPGIDFSKALQKGMEIKLPTAGTPGQGSLWADYQGGMFGDKVAGPELLGGPGAGDVASSATDVATAAAVPTPSPLTFDPVTNSGTVTLPSGETIKASVFPQGGQFQPRLPIGSEIIKIPYNGQEVTGYINNGVAYFPKFPADAVSSATTSGAGTLSGVTAQQIASSPVYQQIYAQEIAKYGAEPSARAIQTAQTIATMKAKAAMAGAINESVKLRTLPAEQLIDQKLTKLSWALNESVGKPQGRSVHLTQRGVDMVFENVHRIAEAAVATRIEPTFEPIDEYPPEPFPVPPRSTPTPAPTSTRVTGEKLQQIADTLKTNVGKVPTEKIQKSMQGLKARGFGEGDPVYDVFAAEIGKRSGGTADKPGPAPTPAPAPTTPTDTTPTGPGREELPDLYRPDAPEAPYTPADPATKSAFGRGLDWLDRAAGKVGGALSTAGRQFTRNVTKEKLKMNWQIAGKPTDSDQLSAWLVQQGVPIGVVNSVYSTMGLPASATPATADQPADAEKAGVPRAPVSGGGQTQDYAFNPKTGKPYTVDELLAYRDKSAPAVATGTTPKPSASTTSTPSATGTFNAANVMNLPGMEKYAKKTAPAKTPNFAGPSGYSKMTTTVKPMTGIPGMTPAATTASLPAGGGAGVKAAATAGPKVTSGGPTPEEQAKLAQRIAQAAKQPVAEMLSMVETKEDIRRIKEFIDQTFVKYGAVSESAFAVRNRLIEHVTQVGAQRRREHSQRMAK